MIALGSDHAGYALKQEIIRYLESLDMPYRDFGTYNEESCDYPRFGEMVGQAVSSGACDRGILICGTGIGISIAANKITGVRAAVCGDCYSAEMTRQHNDANVLALGARVTGSGLALKIVDIFLKTDFLGGKHQRRVDQIKALEHATAAGLENTPN